MGTQLPQKGAQPPPTSAHVYCGQMAGWYTSVLLGTGIYFSPGHIVLDGDKLPPKGAPQTPTFRPMSVVAKRLDESGYHLVWR